MRHRWADGLALADPEDHGFSVEMLGPTAGDVRSTMMTSNRPLEESGKLIGDVRFATAILDRFLHHSDVLQVTGRSYRMGTSGKTSNSTKAPTGPATEEA